jgi:hypothetical protein
MTSREISDHAPEPKVLHRMSYELKGVLEKPEALLGRQYPMLRVDDGDMIGEAHILEVNTIDDGYEVVFRGVFYSPHQPTVAVTIPQLDQYSEQARRSTPARPGVMDGHHYQVFGAVDMPDLVGGRYPTYRAGELVGHSTVLTQRVDPRMTSFTLRTEFLDYVEVNVDIVVPFLNSFVPGYSVALATGGVESVCTVCATHECPPVHLPNSPLKQAFLAGCAALLILTAVMIAIVLTFLDGVLPNPAWVAVLLGAAMALGCVEEMT